VDLELRVFFNKWVKSKIVVAADDVGKQDGDENIKIDEAIFTMNCPWVPLYFTGGYTVLPFGVFEDRLITGLITEDLYEIEEVGATLGFTPDFYELDISFTVYKGQDIIENLEDVGTHDYSPDREEDNDVNSFIANVTLEPVEDMLSLSVFFDSEPGDGRRNLTFGSAFTLDVWKFSFDGEYITALQREDGDNGEENKESAWVAGLAFRPLESVPLELVVRYEDFDNDQDGNQDGILDDRYVAGFSYQFLEWATFFFEYNYLNYEKERGSDAADHVNTFHFRIGLAF
jgi:opacity protein-like surface antigen